MKRGAIVLAKFPFTDLSSSKRRPGVVISGKTSSKEDIIVAFISSIIPATLADTDYLITEGHQEFSNSGLKKDSVIKLDKLATVNISIISGEIGALSPVAMQEIDKCLKIALGL